MTTKHAPATPLPLKFLPDEGNFIINADGAIVGEIPCQGVENDKQIGAYIVHAANAYPRLVASMKRCIAGMPHSAPQEEAISLMRDLGEIAPHR